MLKKPRRESLRESLRIASRVVSSMASSVYSSVSTRRARMLCQSSGESVEGRQPRLQARGCACRLAHSSVARTKAKASADSASSTTPLTRTTQLRCGRPRTVATDAEKVKQVELWQLEKCDLRIKAWEAREIQLEVRVGATRECLSKLGARLKHDRVDDDAEDARNEEGLRDCSFPQYQANPGVSPLRRRKSVKSDETPVAKST